MTMLLASAQENGITVIFNTFGVTLPYFVASCINFFVVIWVLKRFAFGPIQNMLEERRTRIADGEAKLKQIEAQLAQSEANTAAAIARAAADAQHMIDEAREGAAILSEQKAQEAIAQAQQILAKAEVAAKADRDRLTVELKREFGRLVAATTAQVAGKVLTNEDQSRINEETLTRVEA